MKKRFYSTLDGKHIINNENQLILSVWNTFKTKTLAKRTPKYHDLFVKLDALFLTDVFNKFRETGFDYYEAINPCH